MAERHEVEALAASVLAHGDAKQARLSERAPKLCVEWPLWVICPLDLGQPLRGGLCTDDLLREIADRLLLFRKREIHGSCSLS